MSYLKQDRKQNKIEEQGEIILRRAGLAGGNGISRIFCSYSFEEVQCYEIVRRNSLELLSETVGEMQTPAGITSHQHH